MTHVQVYPLDFASALGLGRIIRDKEAKAKRYLPCDEVRRRLV
jgi:hypothetical protein